MMENNPFADLIPSNQNVNSMGASSAPMQNPFADLIPKKPPMDNRSVLDKTVDAINSVGDPISKGIRHAVMAPGQFAAPLIDAALGTNLAKDLNESNSYLDKVYKQEHPDEGIGSELLSLGGEMALPGGAASKALTEGMKVAKGLPLLGKAATLAGAGGLAGLLSSPLVYDESGKMSPGEKIQTGANVGALLEPAMVGGGKIAGKVADVAGDILRGLADYIKPGGSANKIMGSLTNVEETLARKAAGDRLGLNLTPAEAANRNLIAKEQAGLGYTQEGAKKLEDQQIQRGTAEKNMISDLMNSISKDNSSAARTIRDTSARVQQQRMDAITSKEREGIDSLFSDLSSGEGAPRNVRDMSAEILAKKRAARQEQAQPLYEAAYKEEVAPNRFNALMKKDGTIESSVNSVLSDPNYRVELEGYAPNSIKVLDLAKRKIDSSIEGALSGQKPDRETARVLMGAKERLVKATDQYSDNYRNARKIFAGESEPINDLENSILGKISKMDESQLNQVSKTIFNPRETDLNVLSKFKNEIVKEDPDIWKSMVRHEMDRRLNSSSAPLNGANFYKNVLQKPQDYQQFKEAVKGFPELETKLDNLRATFKNSDNKYREIKGTNLANIGAMKDKQLKQVSSVIFNPRETDMNSFKEIRDVMQRENPQGWKNIMRNEMERRMSKADTNSGTAFYKGVLRNENDFNHFMAASEGMPEVQQKLRDMREVLPYIFNKPTTKAAKGQRENSMDMVRNAFNAAGMIVKKHFADKYDQAAIDLITKGKWDQEISKIRQIKNEDTRNAAFGELLTRISGASIPLANKQFNR